MIKNVALCTSGEDNNVESEHHQFRPRRLRLYASCALFRPRLLLLVDDWVSEPAASNASSVGVSI